MNILDVITKLKSKRDKYKERIKKNLKQNNAIQILQDILQMIKIDYFIQKKIVYGLADLQEKNYHLILQLVQSIDEENSKHYAYIITIIRLLKKGKINFAWKIFEDLAKNFGSLYIKVIQEEIPVEAAISLAAHLRYEDRSYALALIGIKLYKTDKAKSLEYINQSLRTLYKTWENYKEPEPCKCTISLIAETIKRYYPDKAKALCDYGFKLIKQEDFYTNEINYVFFVNTLLNISLSEGLKRIEKLDKYSPFKPELLAKAFSIARKKIKS